MNNLLHQNGIKVELYQKKNDTWAILLQEIVFSYKGQLYTIPVGFKSDGASLPRFFWRLIGHPFDMAYLREAIIHDYLYKYQPCIRKEADRFFFNLLEDNNLGIKRYFIYWGLRIGGWVAWKKHKRKLKNYTKFLKFSKALSNYCSMRGASLYNTCDVSTLKRLYNKIYYGYSSEIGRYYVRKLNPIFRTALYILYFNYEIGGDKSDFLRVNNEFEQNSLKIIRTRYYKFDIRRYFAMKQIKKCKRLYDLFGWVIWNKERR